MSSLRWVETCLRVLSMVDGDCISVFSAVGGELSVCLQSHYTKTLKRVLLGDSGGVVNSLDFCPASLKSLGCFYFRCVLSSHWKAVTVNLRILHCQI